LSASDERQKISVSRARYVAARDHENANKLLANRESIAARCDVQWT